MICSPQHTSSKNINKPTTLSTSSEVTISKNKKTAPQHNSDHHHHQRGMVKQQQNHKLTAETDVRRGSAPFRNNDAANNNNFTRTSAYDPYPNWNNSNKLVSSKNNESSTNSSVNVLNNNSPRSARITPDATAGDGVRAGPAAAKPLNQVVASAMNNNKGGSQKQHQQQYRTNNGANSAGSGLIKLGGVGGLWRRSPQTSTTTATATTSSSSPPVASTNNATTSIDAFQPSYQHVIDNAQMRRKSPSATPQQQRRQQQPQQQHNKIAKTNDDTNNKQQQRPRGGATNNSDAKQQAAVEAAPAPSPSSFDQQQQVVYQQQQAPVVESAELMEQIARQLLVAPIKTKEYQHHFDRLVKLSPTFVQNCCAKMIDKSLDPTNKDDKKVIKVAQVLKQITDKEMITLLSIHEIFKDTIENRSAVEADDDGKLLSMLISKLVHLELTDLGKVLHALRPSDFALVVRVLKNLTECEGEATVSGKYREANVSLLDMLPRVSDDDDDSSEVEVKQKLLDWLRDSQLDFLEPLLVMQVELPAQLETNLNSNNLYKWLRDKVPLHLHGQPAFIQTLLKCCLSHITDAASKSEGEAKSKKHDEEKQLFHKLQGLFQKLLADDTQLQLCALNTVQQHCCEWGFPKGMMRRLFEYLYNDDIVDEDVFLSWKEIDNDDAVPGKEKALAQVMSWLTWLQEADTEDEEDE